MKTLHSFYFIISIFFFSAGWLQVNAQSGVPKFMPGEVVSITGDTLKGQILRSLNWYDKSPQEVVFRKSEEGSEIRFDPEEVASFEVDNLVFVVGGVKMETSPVMLNMLRHDPELHFIEDTVFLEVLVPGAKSLYYHADKDGKQHFYVKHKDEYQLLIYKKYLHDKNGIIVAKENKKFQGQLKFYLNDCPALTTRIEKCRYYSGEFKEIFGLYYECKSEGPDYKVKEKRAGIKVGAIAGVALGKVKFEEGHHLYDIKDEFTSSPGIIAGISFNALHSKNNRISFLAEVIYTSHKIKFHAENFDDEQNYQIEDIQLGWGFVKLNTLINYEMVKTESISVFINAGFSNGMTVWRVDDQRKEIAVNNIIEISDKAILSRLKNYEMGILAGGGVMVGNFSFQLRYELGSNLALNTHSKDINIQRVFGTLGYWF